MVKKVYLVGAGPGDLGLITVKALDLVKRADTIIYDRLANEEILKYAKDGAKLVYVGKKTGHHIFKQDKINKIRSEEHTSELQSHSFISYAVFCLKKKILERQYKFLRQFTTFRMRHAHLSFFIAI